MEFEKLLKIYTCFVIVIMVVCVAVCVCLLVVSRAEKNLGGVCGYYTLEYCTQNS